MGNSHSHPLRVLDVLAPMVGHWDQKNAHVNILGASLKWNWDHGDQNKWPQTLAPANSWDALVLLSWDSNDEAYAPKFAGEALKGNPRCRTYIYVIWPDANMDFEEPPAIPDQTLAPVTLDQYVRQPIKVEGGVGHITWSVSDGKLPWGVMLTPAGILIGNPGEPGAFAFTLSVSDSHPAGPRTSEKAFTWTIGAVWVARGGNNPKNKDDGTALVLAVKILDGPAGKTPRDGVHFFIDGRHDRGAIYGPHDTHFFVPRQQQPNRGSTWAQWVSGKPNWFTNVQVAEIEGGYTVELSLGFNYFVGEGNWLPFTARGVYGFDVAVDEGDDKNPAQQTWRGADNDAQDTSHFGTIVLVNEKAAK